MTSLAQLPDPVILKICNISPSLISHGNTPVSDETWARVVRDSQQEFVGPISSLHPFLDLPQNELDILRSLCMERTVAKGDIIQLQDSQARYVSLGLREELGFETSFVVMHGFGPQTSTVEVNAGANAFHGESELLIRGKHLQMTKYGVKPDAYRASVVCLRGGTNIFFDSEALASNLSQLPTLVHNMGSIVVAKFFRRQTLWERAVPLSARLGITLWYIVFASAEVELGEGVDKNNRPNLVVKYPKEWKMGGEGPLENAIGIPVSLRSLAQAVESDNVSVGKVLTLEREQLPKKEVERYHERVRRFGRINNSGRIVDDMLRKAFVMNADNHIWVRKSWADAHAKRSPSSRLGRSVVQI